MKKCFKCEVEKPLSEFYRHKNMLDGHLNKCKDCTRHDVIQNRNAKLDYYREYDRQRVSTPARQAQMLSNTRRDRALHPEKSRARSAVAYALRTGKITRLPCEVCGTTENVDAHHDDYSKPLDVKWLCRVHHLKEHGRYIEAE